MKMRMLIAFALLLVTTAHAQVKCEADLHGFKIHAIYIVGSQSNAVVWAYKHIAEATCLTPTLDPSKADAILDLEPAISGRAEESSQTPLTVTCSSSPGSSVCVDSDGNEMDTICDRAGNCTSSYGPSMASAIGGLVGAWVRNSWYQTNAFLFTKDHKLLWKSEGYKGLHWYELWPDLLRDATFIGPCNVPASKTKNRYREYASEKCGVKFDPLASIDLKLLDRQTAEQQKLGQKDEMLRNAQDAAAKQNQAQP